MIERLVENWLDSAGERGFETPFAHLLAAEGHRVLQGPVHHPFEHGKDIITIASDGAACAFQLKGPGLTRLADFEAIHGQILALLSTAVSHPAIGEPRRPDRAYLVTNGVLTPQVRDRIQQMNTGNAALQLPKLEPVEREHLLGRFIAAHGAYLPQSLPDIRTLLELHYCDAASVFPVRSFAIYLNGILPLPPQEVSVPERRRAVASAALLTAYAADGWTRADNHLSIAQAWLTLCICIQNFAESTGMSPPDWEPTHDLALEAARTALASLSREAASAEDVAIPDLTEGLVYPSRALLISGFLAAYMLSERTLDPEQNDVTERVRTVLLRERANVLLTGECEVPHYMLLCAALEHCGEVRPSELMMLSLVYTLATSNRRHSEVALPDPYHDVEQILLQRVSGESDLATEEFDGRSYGLNVAVEWVARRLWRRHLAAMWPEITRVEFMEYIPATPQRYLAPHDEDGELKMWFAGQPQSWTQLLHTARSKDFSALPAVIRRRRELLPYLPLLFPYRLTSTLAAAIDELAYFPAGPEGF